MSVDLETLTARVVEALGDAVVEQAESFGDLVVRVRPDGTGMELVVRGTRNILAVAIAPTLDLFTRDNTNDGGGWNVRFHHFSGMTDHGYPTLFTNFANEVVTPLADFGGGSGVGGLEGAPAHAAGRWRAMDGA